jgi:hypothetical protein
VEALQHAERLLTLPVEDTYYLFGFNQVLLDGYKGACLQQFYRRDDPGTHRYLAEAREALERALESDTPVRRKRYYLGDLSKIEARRGEIEAACFYASRSLALPNHVESKSIWQRIVDLRSLLQPYQNEALVKTLEEQIRRQVENNQNKDLPQ